MSISGLNIGTGALSAYQVALEVTGQNIANVNTPGYTRQRARLVQAKELLRSFGAMGTGVRVQGIERIRDAFIDLEIRQQASDVGSSETIAGMYERVESIFNEPSAVGINTLLGNFFDSLNDLANFPEDIGVRDTVALTAQTLTNQMHIVNNELDQLRFDIDKTIQNSVTEINTLTRKIAGLNKEILKLETGRSGPANNLRDQREQTMKELAALTEFSAHEAQTGEITVSIEGINVVFGDNSYDLGIQVMTGDELPVHEVVLANTGACINFSSGQMYGYFQSRDVNIVNEINNLDALSRALIDEINEIHVDGRGVRGFSTITSVNAVSDSTATLDSAGLNITPVDTTFDINVYDAGADTETSVNISVDVSTDSLDDVATNINTALTAQGITEVTASVNANNELVLTSSDTDFTFTFGNVTDNTNNFLSAMGLNTFFTGTDASNVDVNALLLTSPEFMAAAMTNAPGDNSNALRMADLRTSKVLDSNTRSIEDFYQANIVTLGAEVDRAQIEYEASSGFLTELQLKREVTSGVNLDEEAANLIRFQRAYEASARYISVIDQILNVLVNGLI